MPTISLGDLAERLCATLIGDAALMVDHPAGLHDATAGALTFLANPKYQEALGQTAATAVLVRPEITEAPCALLQVENPDLAFARALTILQPPPPPPPPGVHETAVVAAGAQLAKDVHVGACAVIGENVTIGAGTVIHPHVVVGANCTLGANVILYPQVTLYHDVQLGARVIVHSGAVIGSDGFGFCWDGSQHVKIPQVGRVVIGDDVEIGANCCIDRARFGETVIGPGTKIDNLIQIAHNVKIGAHCAFAALCGISGSSTVGNGVLMGGMSGVSGHVSIGEGAILSAGTGVTKNLPGGQHYTGFPAKPHKEQIADWHYIKKIPRLKQEVRELQERLRALEVQSDENTEDNA